MRALSSSPAAERMRRHRQRRKKGLRCVTIQLFESEINVLVSRGLLAQEARGDRRAVRAAMHHHLKKTLV